MSQNRIIVSLPQVPKRVRGFAVQVVAISRPVARAQGALIPGVDYDKLGRAKDKLAAALKGLPCNVSCGIGDNTLQVRLTWPEMANSSVPVALQASGRAIR